MSFPENFESPSISPPPYYAYCEQTGTHEPDTCNKKSDLLPQYILQQPHPCSASSLEQRTVSNNNNTFKTDLNSTTLAFLFRKINEKTKDFEECEHFSPYECNPHFIFPDVICPVESAIYIQKEDAGKCYLHGNRMTQLDDRDYIATQAPVAYPNNPDAGTQGLFWRICYEVRGSVIDLTKNSDEIIPYYPVVVGENTEYESVNLKITHLASAPGLSEKENKIEGLSKKIFSLIDLNTDEERKITRYHFNQWPDKEGIHPERLLELIEILEHYREDDELSTPIVHCRAGVGRSGTLIAAWTLKHLFDKNSDALTKDNYLDVIESIILSGREARGPSFVQTTKQYITLVGFAEYLLAK